MKLSVKGWGSLVFLLLFFHAWSQEDSNIFSRDNTLKFAEHLMAAHEYESAAMEYERLLFMNKKSDSIRLRLLRAYRLAGAYDRGRNRFNDFYSPEDPSTPRPFAQEYLKLLLLSRDYGRSRSLLNANEEFPASYKNNVELGVLLLQRDWEEAEGFAANEDISDPYLQSLAEKSTNLKQKSPFLASLMSAVVPGTGKMYTGNWGDGAVALMFVGGNAFGAYRGFARNGVESFYGWFFTALGTGFYLGNIYGSYQSAVEHNAEQENRLHNEVESYFYTRY